MLEFNQIYLGDCIEIMRGIDNGSIDLTVTSPPYGSLRGDTPFDYRPITTDLYRAMKSGGVVVWVTSDETINGSESGVSFEQALRFKYAGFRLHDTMIYRKTGFSFPSKGRYNQLFEYMFVFSKGAPKTFNPICDEPRKWGGSWGTTTVRKRDGSLVKRRVGNEGRGSEKREGEAPFGYHMRSNVWVIKNARGFGHKDKRAYKHPSTFPESLAHDHILSWSNPGDIVLDPMCGSGTTCVAAKKLERNFIGIDISEEYVALARERLGI